MEHLPFVIWLLLYPITVEISFYLFDKRRLEPDTVKGQKTNGFIHLVIWIVVAVLVY